MGSRVRVPSRPQKALNENWELFCFISLLKFRLLLVHIGVFSNSDFFKFLLLVDYSAIGMEIYLFSSGYFINTIQQIVTCIVGFAVNLEFGAFKFTRFV
jgi:hypothetical protein